MPSAGEAMGNQSQMRSVLDAGLQQLSANETVTFTQYTRVALSSDGSVFWVATATKLTVEGSLHYATDRTQDEDQTIATNHVLLTAEAEVSQFNRVAPGTMWIGSWPTSAGEPPLQVAFARRGEYYEQAQLWHYAGFAIYPALQSQIVASSADLPVGPIVSNSLPIWLAQNSLAPVYPSFLVPDNIAPPYVVAHIPPEGTTAIGGFPVMGPWPGTIVPNSGASPLEQIGAAQLMRDHVTLTLYGFTNDMALQYLCSLIDASENAELFGFANVPAIVDAKRSQVEIATLAQKKTITIDANYYQSTADAVARRLILEADVPTATVSSTPP